MVLDALLPALAPWQQVFEVAGPARDVLALAPALGLGEIQDDLHPPPHSPHRLSLGQPLRLQDRQDGIGIDLPNTGLPDDWVDIGLEGRLPLVTVLLVAPGRAVDGDVFDGCLLEGDTLSGLLDLFCSPFGDRVNSSVRSVRHLAAAFLAPFRDTTSALPCPISLSFLPARYR